MSRVEMEKVSIKAGAEGREALLCLSYSPSTFCPVRTICFSSFLI